MNCYNHPNVPTTATCADCGAPICTACTRMLGGKPYCPADYALVRFDEGEAARPAMVPAYQPEKKTEHIPPQNEELALVEKYKGPTNFLYSPAANRGIQPQETAAVLAEYEDTWTTDTRGRQQGRDGALIWSGIGLTCAIFALLILNFVVGIPSSVTSSASYISPAGGATLILMLTTVISTLWTMFNREESTHPHLIKWIGIVSLILLVMFLVEAIFFMYKYQEAYDQYFRDLMNKSRSP